MIKTKHEPYRCGECKIEKRVYLYDDEGNLLKDSHGIQIYDVFESNTHSVMKEHLIDEHGLDEKEIYGWGQCFDCLYTYKRSSLPISDADSGGLVQWCYDCAQNRCINYGIIRRYMFKLLRGIGIHPTGTETDRDMFELLRKQNSS
ncbi:MAG: hypothetical protein R3251_03955 [Candidatus Spechtbacterales bacterium]|nr:hypothetical protein [Candidatus Spechtbacterales bacterium]